MDMDSLEESGWLEYEVEKDPANLRLAPVKHTSATEKQVLN